MRLFRVWTAIPVALLAVVTVAACGDDEKDSGGSTTAPAATTPAGDGNGGADEYTITAKDFSFSPIESDVKAGEAIVTLNNTGEVFHTMTVYADDQYAEAVEGADTENVAAGESGEFTITFEEGAEYFFRCELHPTQMTGELTVEP